MLPVHFSLQHACRRQMNQRVASLEIVGRQVRHILGNPIWLHSKRYSAQRSAWAAKRSDFAARLQSPIKEMRPYKSRPASNKDFHAIDERSREYHTLSLILQL
jgi:hypothetical protein